MTSCIRSYSVLSSFCRARSSILVISRNSSNEPRVRVSPTEVRPPDPSQISKDMIGPPNQVSNLRPIIFHTPKNESHLERQLRLEREKVQKWNEDFWIQHNSSFIQESSAFRAKRLESSSDPERKSLSADEMSEFYKAFLDKNWKTHVSYNFEWYQKNFYLVYLSFKVHLTKLVLRK